MENDVYPVGPASVPADLTRPTAAYRRHAYVAVAGLLVFLGLYFALAGWFAWTAYRLITSIGASPNPVFAILGGGCAAFLALFMFKAVLFVRRGKHTGDVELKPADHPRLFAFLHRVADEAGAPRPHRVYLSAQVNAAVFFDLSIANLIIPSRKNLEIGLGLINVLTLGELKAVLAHEFGHFAQRTMAVGRWVYIAQQIAGHIVVRRDALDRFLHGLSNIDIRVAWIGWILRLIVWSIRSLVDTLFGWVVIAQRALSREMELQADLVAVSLTGSDALIHALHRLDAADDAMDRAMSFAAAERHAGRAVADMFALQSHMLERKREILGDPDHGKVPPLPTAPASHRLFKAKLAHPPRMWSTHPPNEVRENNAKRVYVAAAIDERSGWALFDDPAAIRSEVTATLYAGASGDDGVVTKKVPMSETLATLDSKFDRRYLDPAYRGVYLGRSVVRAAGSVSELYGATVAVAEVPAALEALYPASLATDLEKLRELSEEKVIVEATKRGILEMPGGIVEYRGQRVKRRELPALVESIEKQVVAARKVIEDHDRRVRTAHLSAASTLGGGWDEYLRGLASLVHYADHQEADLDDAMGSLDNVYAVVTADRKVTDGEIDRLVAEATSLHFVLSEIHHQASSVSLGPTMAERLEVDSWSEALGELELPEPHPENIGQWLGAAHSWCSAAGGALSALFSLSLDELLRAEEEVALHVRSGQAIAPAAPAPRVPLKYTVLTPGRERPRQTKLGWWDRFQVADGFVPAFTRFAVAGAMVGLVLWAGRTAVGDATILVVNGLARPMEVDIGSNHFQVGPRSHVSVKVDAGEEYAVSASASGKVVESFHADVGSDYGHYVYNVLGAAPMVEWDPATNVERMIGASRWRETDADRVIDDVRKQVNARTDEEPVLVSLAGLHPQMFLGELGEPDASNVVAVHARWEPPNTRYLGAWFDAARAKETFGEILEARLADDPDEVISRRLEQDLGDEKVVCADHTARAEAAPDDPGWQYLAARCIEDPAARSQTIRALAEQFPDHGWIAFAAGSLALDGESLDAGLAQLEVARDKLPALRDEVTERYARLRRATGGERVDLSEMVDESPVLAALVPIERGEPQGELSPALRSIRFLARGEIEESVLVAGGTPHEPTAVVLAASSDTAPPELVDKALAIAPDALDPASAIYCYALATRAGRDGAQYLERVPAELRSQLAPFFQAAMAKKPDADKLLSGADLQVRALAYSAVAVALGAGCPPKWRDLARRLLFPGERPFLL